MQFNRNQTARGRWRNRRKKSRNGKKSDTNQEEEKSNEKQKKEKKRVRRKFYLRRKGGRPVERKHKARRNAEAALPVVVTAGVNIVNLVRIPVHFSWRRGDHPAMLI